MYCILALICKVTRFQWFHFLKQPFEYEIQAGEELSLGACFHPKCSDEYESVSSLHISELGSDDTQKSRPLPLPVPSQLCFSGIHVDRVPLQETRANPKGDKSAFSSECFFKFGQLAFDKDKRFFNLL